MNIYYAIHATHRDQEGLPEKWYLSWCRNWDSGWSVDRTYLLSSIAVLDEDAPFWEVPWSSCKTDELNAGEAMRMMDVIHNRRLEHGYTLSKSGCAIYDDEGHHTTIEVWSPDLEGRNE